MSQDGKESKCKVSQIRMLCLGEMWQVRLRVHGGLYACLACLEACMNWTLLVGMHGKNAEFGNLIPGKFCFWREIFAILKVNLSFRWIFWSFSSKYFWKFVNNSHFWRNFWPYSRDVSHFFQPWFKQTSFWGDIVRSLI